MKKRWETPRAVVEKFEPNEYVAVCWTVACKVGYGNYGGYGWDQWGGQGPYGGECHDHTGSCSKASNNQFNVDENGNVSFYAENSSDQGSLNGGYTDYIDANGDGSINDGDIIFWYTLSGDKKRRWNHYGTVVNPTPEHPNRS
nr:hypothetical protein [uncultured Mediterraneibacter sp.]